MRVSLVKMIVPLLAAIPFLIAPHASALEFRLYNQSAFEAAQAAGEPIVVDVHATWCSTCRAQRRILENLADDPRFANVVLFQVDYDTEKDIMRMFAAPQRSTLIAFLGDTETDRLIAVTNAGAIEALLLSMVE